MPLSGVNKLCKTCKNNCKQWEQIKIIVCPIYENKENKKEVIEDVLYQNY